MQMMHGDIAGDRGAVVARTPYHIDTFCTRQAAQMHARAGLAQGRGEVGLFDVHVIEVAEELHVFEIVRVEKCDRVRVAIEQIRFVAIERFVKQRLLVRRGAFGEHAQFLREQCQRVIARDRAFPAALHRADDRGRAEVAGEIDDAVDELAGARAHGGPARRSSARTT